MATTHRIACLSAGEGEGGWRSIHIWAPWGRLDELLEVVAGVAVRADQWFFIRYAEGGPHLRVRLKGDPLALTGLVEELAASACAAGAERVRGERYEREIRRYGGAHAIAAAEAVFCRSTALALHARRLHGDRRGAQLGYAGLLAAAALDVAGLSGARAARVTGAYAEGAARIARLLSSAPAGAPATSIYAEPPYAEPPLARSVVEVAARWWALGARMASGRAGGGHEPAVAYLDALRGHLGRVAEGGEGEGDPAESVVLSQIHMTCNRLGLSVEDEALLMRALSVSAKAAHSHDLTEGSDDSVR